MRLSLEKPAAAPERWAAIAGHIGAWCDATGIAQRDVVVLVPFAQLLPEARAAFARRGGWMPRIETTRTLASSLGPATPAQFGELSFDAALDALAASQLLRSQAWGAAWARHDARGFEQAVDDVVDTAQALVRAAAALAPVKREAHWACARDVLAPAGGPGATARLLARVALEWAVVAPVPPTDSLFTSAAPAAWIAVQAGGPDALIEGLMCASNLPCLVLDTDGSEEEAFRHLPRHTTPAFAICDGFEEEAQCAAAQVLLHLQRGECPVALIAQDRLLVRRVRALLERHRVRLLDETGWTLSTTRAAAQVMGLLHAARADATTDDLLDWLKGTAWGRGGSGAALAALEAACRRQQRARVSALDSASLDAAAAPLWSAAAALLGRFGATPRQTLPAWLAALSQALQACGSLDAMRADDAGQQVLATLHLLPAAAGQDSWVGGATRVVMDLTEFRRWVDLALERETFVPTVTFDAAPEVIVTPLARAMLRPFAAVVFPGADDKRLGASPATIALLGDTQAAALGVPTAAERRRAELSAFVNLLDVPQLTLMRRRFDGNDPIADSPLIERLSMALAREGRTLTGWHDPRMALALAPTPIRMTAPSAPQRLPARLSASACEALRACPYRFFTLNLLRLREADELERELEKRDYGTWLHALLFEFHRTRGAPAEPAVEVERLVALAQSGPAAAAVGEADFVPYAASFASLAPRYIEWLHARDAAGARWLAGEQEVTLPLADVPGIELRGIIDRIDERRSGDHAVIELIDYKTGSASALREKLRQPLEDTQLAFYAALMRSRSELPLRARYLALDGSKGLDEIEHPDVETSAAALVDGLTDELRRLRAGAGLPALGVGSTCDHCAARGVCRRDHWAEATAPAGPQ